MRICIASSRPIGKRCRKWALKQGYKAAAAPQNSRIFISVLYDTLLKEPFIKNRKCFNFHPGILPQYRGAGAFSWAIINKEKFTGVTLHEIDKDIDHGRVLDMQLIPIEPDDTAETLFNKAMEVIFVMFKSWLPKLLSGEYQAIPLSKDGDHIYYRKDLEAAKDLTRFVRAFTFAGKENAYFINAKGKKVYLDYEAS